MPLYDMTCEACKHDFEVLHEVNEPHPDKCPKCGKKRVRQAFKTPPAYHNRYSPMHPRAKRGRGF